MEIEKLVEEAPDIVGGTWANRIDHAASLLFVHGYIPESQRKKIADKMNRQFEDGIASGRIIARVEQPIIDELVAQIANGETESQQPTPTTGGDHVG